MLGRLLLLFVVVGLAEIFLLLKVGEQIGFWWTVGLIFITAVLGATLTKTQGAATMMKAQNAMREGRMPHGEVLDGLLIVVAGAVLLTPGFLTDALGFTLLIPPVRKALRERLANTLKARVQMVGSPGANPMAGTQTDDDIIEAEIIDD